MGFPCFSPSALSHGVVGHFCGRGWLCPAATATSQHFNLFNTLNTTPNNPTPFRRSSYSFNPLDQIMLITPLTPPSTVEPLSGASAWELSRMGASVRSRLRLVVCLDRVIWTECLFCVGFTVDCCFGVVVDCSPVFSFALPRCSLAFEFPVAPSTNVSMVGYALRRPDTSSLN
jgi:hypothetical protein